jgi:hypothetical protein
MRSQSLRTSMHLFPTTVLKNTYVRSMPQITQQYSSYGLSESRIMNQRNFAFCSCFAQLSLTILMPCTLFLKWTHFAVVYTLFWLMIICDACNKTNLMHYLSSVYSITIPLHVSGLLVAHHEVTMYICNNWYMLYVLVDCQWAWKVVAPCNANCMAELATRKGVWDTNPLKKFGCPVKW